MSCSHRLLALALCYILQLPEVDGNMDFMSLKPSISIANVHEFDSRLQDTGDSILQISTQEYYQYVDTPRDFDVVMLFSSTDMKYHCDLCPGQLKEYRRLATVYKSSLTRHGFKKERRRERTSPHTDNHVIGDEQSDDDDDYYTEDDETEDIILDHIDDIDIQDDESFIVEGTHIHFLWMDIKTSSKAFTSLGIRQLGTIAVFPALREQTYADLGPIGVVGITAQSMAAWLILRTGHARDLYVPPTATDWVVTKVRESYLYLKTLMYVTGFGALLFWATQRMDVKAVRRRWNSQRSVMTSFCMWAVCFACVVFTSGFMWCTIRGMGAMHITQEGRVSIVVGGMRGQTLTEAFIIGMINSGIAFVTVALLSAPKHDPNFVGPIGSRITFLLFIILLLLSFEIFFYRRTKNGGYPFRMLL